MQYGNFVHILCVNLTKGKIMLYMSMMDREQVKAALMNCATTHNVSLSEFASEAGVAPATITGFVNDSKSSNRNEHNLSMTTIGKLSKRWPNLAEHLKIANPTSDVRDVPYVGMMNPQTKQVGGLEPNKPGTIMINKASKEFVAYGVSFGHPVMTQRVFLCDPEPIYDNFEHYINKLVVVDCDEGRMIGFLQQAIDSTFWLAGTANMWGLDNQNNYKYPEKIDICSNIKWIQPVEWIKP